jgi:L-alanine-DL-glutamate epimerase-like enolase superfamily enzyme
MGLLKEDGTPKLGLKAFEPYAPEMGLMQWFHYRGPPAGRCGGVAEALGRDQAAHRPQLGRQLPPQCADWFDRQMEALADFDTTVTFCFTPEHLGIEPHHTSPPRDPQGLPISAPR